VQQVEIRVKGRIDERWSEWLACLAITYGEQGETLLAGPILDQAELYGLLAKLRDLGLSLRSVRCVEFEAAKAK
jgi:hypothetical protein